MVVNCQIVEKELIEKLNFPNKEVLSTRDDIRKRYSSLRRALYLGNLERTKIKILFEDDKALKCVFTTIWGLTDQRVILKKGVVLPTNRIHFVSE